MTSLTKLALSFHALCPILMSYLILCPPTYADLAPLPP
jgi:hypothetical protein